MLGFLSKIGFKTPNDFVSAFTPLVNDHLEAVERVISYQTVYGNGRFWWVFPPLALFWPFLVVLTNKKVFFFRINVLNGSLGVYNFYKFDQLQLLRFSDGYFWSGVRIKLLVEQGNLDFHYPKIGRGANPKTMEGVVQSISGLNLDQLRAKYNGPFKRLIINWLKVPLVIVGFLALFFLSAVLYGVILGLRGH